MNPLTYTHLRVTVHLASGIITYPASAPYIPPGAPATLTAGDLDILRRRHWWITGGWLQIVPADLELYGRKAHLVLLPHERSAPIAARPRTTVPAKGIVGTWLVDGDDTRYFDRAIARQRAKLRGVRLLDLDHEGNVWDGPLFVRRFHNPAALTADPSIEQAVKETQRREAQRREEQLRASLATAPASFTPDAMRRLFGTTTTTTKESTMSNDQTATTTVETQYGLRRPDGTVEWDVVKGLPNEHGNVLNVTLKDVVDYGIGANDLAKIIHERQKATGHTHGSYGYNLVKRQRIVVETEPEVLDEATRRINLGDRLEAHAASGKSRA